jgi:hypothetical protein
MQMSHDSRRFPQGCYWIILQFQVICPLVIERDLIQAHITPVVSVEIGRNVSAECLKFLHHITVVRFPVCRCPSRQEPMQYV